MIDDNKTPAKALKELLAIPRLRFGDPEQIQNLVLLRMAEAIVGQDIDCPDCDGDGECSRCEQECKTCEGSGVLISTRDSVYKLTYFQIASFLGKLDRAA